MLYDYIYLKVYEWISKMIAPFALQITSTIILSLFPLSIIYLILKFLSYLNIYNYEMSFTTNKTVLLFRIIFLIILILNQIYFFAYKNWKVSLAFLLEGSNVLNVKSQFLLKVN